MKIFYFSKIIILLLFLSSCGQRHPCPEICSVDEQFITERNVALNLDSLAVWHGPTGEHWIIATAKSGNILPVYDAVTGKLIKQIGEPGTGLGQLSRPNGIAVAGDLLFIVERDNKRLQIFSLPEGRFLGMTEGVLEKPYGIAVIPDDNSGYIAYVTDDSSRSGRNDPRKIFSYHIILQDDKVAITLIKSFGDESGPGALLKVESIVADKQHNRLIIADEFKRERNLKIYTLDGIFTGIVIGKNLFMHDPEGIALYETDAQNGYIIATDQDFHQNCFYLFDRKTLEHLVTFKGAHAINTDGIAVTNQAFGPFNDGALYVMSDDGNVCAYNWQDIVGQCHLNDPE